MGVPSLTTGTGMSGAWELLSGAEPRREAPAQGPRFDEAGDGATDGAFRVSRHPNNLGPTLIERLIETSARNNFLIFVFTLFAILFIFVGAQFIGMGLLGEYIGRIYHDVRARPRYFVQEEIGNSQLKNAPAGMESSTR